MLHKIKMSLLALLLIAPAVWANDVPAVSGKKLESALIELIKSMPEERFENSLGSGQVQGLHEFNSIEYQVYPPGADLDTLDDYGNILAEKVSIFSDASVQGSRRSIMTAENNKSSADGVSLFKNDIYTAGFYFRTSDGFNKKIPMEDLAKQPWFEFDYTSQKYFYRQDGAQEKILSTVDKKTPALFHGCDIRDAKDVNLFSKLNRGFTDAEQVGLIKELRERANNEKYSSKLRSDFQMAANKLLEKKLSKVEISELALEYSKWKLT